MVNVYPRRTVGCRKSSSIRTGFGLDALEQAFFGKHAGIRATSHWKLEMCLQKRVKPTFKLFSRLYNDHQQPIKVRHLQAGIQQG